MKKKIGKEGIDYVVIGSSEGNYIRVRNPNEKIRPKEETIRISEMEDDEEVIISGKQLKELQGFWRR